MTLPLKNGFIIWNEALRPILLTLIEGAEKNIYIATYKVEISDKPDKRVVKKIVETLASASKRKVDVKFLVDVPNFKGGLAKINRQAIAAMQKMGILARYIPGERCLHAKLFTVDGTQAIIGSHNFSGRSFLYNIETSVYVNSPEEIKKADVKFLEYWALAKGLPF